MIEFLVYHHNAACAYTDDDEATSDGAHEAGSYPLAALVDSWESLDQPGVAQLFRCSKCNDEFVVEFQFPR